MNGRRAQRARWLACIAITLWLLPAASRAGEDPDEPVGETIELIPEDRAGFEAANLFAPIGGLLRGNPGYWYRNRTVQVETTPPGAILDLFYIRSNFQKAYEQADAPVTVVLPPRVSASRKDTLRIRALLDGYRQTEIDVPVRAGQEKVVIELEPLANSLVALTHVYFAGRGSLNFLTKEALTFRLQKARDGLSVVLTETGLGPDARGTLEGVRSTLVERVEPRQLGEDLVVGVVLSEAARAGEVQTRSRQSFDAIRGLHSFSLDLVPPDGGAAGIERARAALAALQPADVTGCAETWDAALREELDPAALARALAVQGSFVDPYLRAAMRRLGELSPDGTVRTTDGGSYAVAVPIELAAAGSEAHVVVGYLAMLRSFIAKLEAPEHRRGVLRGLVAPELPIDRFDGVADIAEGRERACREAD